MKIGQVGKKYGISRDHLYYYINYGLLVPPKSGKQYIFDQATLHDLDTILALQQLGFTLAEIHHILSLYRITDGENDDIREELLQLYRHQKEKCQQELAKLHDQVEGLNQKIRELTARQKGPSRKVGVPLSMLGLLACPRCHKTLALSQVAMDTRYIYQAQLACPCGYKAHIHDGILMTENRYTDNDDTPDVHRLMYKDLPAGMISLFQQACNFMNRQLDGMDLSGSVVLETYVNAWFFLYTQQSHFPENGQYIIVDKYPETLAMYKKLMEQEGHPLNILYIADSTINSAVEVIRSCDLVITPDTSIVHIARAFDKPMVAVYNKRKLKDTGLPGYHIWAPGYDKARQIVCEEANVADVAIESVWPVIKEQADRLVAARS